MPKAMFWLAMTLAMTALLALPELICDSSDPTVTHDIVARVAADHGPIDTLVYNAAPTWFVCWWPKAAEAAGRALAFEVAMLELEQWLERAA